MRSSWCPLVAILASCSTSTADLEAPEPGDASPTDAGIDSARPDAATSVSRTSSIVIVAEPSAYHDHGDLDGDTIHLATGRVGCAYAWPFPGSVLDTGDTPLDGTVEREGSDAFEVRSAPRHLEPGTRGTFTVVGRGGPVARAEGSLVARYRTVDGVEVTARRRLTLRIEDYAVVDPFMVPLLPVFNVLVIIDGSPDTAPEWDAVETTFRRLHAQASGVVRVRWSVALGSPGDPVVLDLGGAERVEDPPDVALLLDAAQRALTSGRTGDPLGAAVQALDRLQPGQPGRWSVLVISARDGRVIDPASLTTRVDIKDFQVGGAMCSAPPTPVLDAMAAALGAQLRTVCEPAPHLGDTGIVPRFALALSQAAASESIRVEVDGRELPRQASSGREHWWAAPGMTSEVSLAHFATPPPGTPIVVRYQISCAPDARDFERR
jgi:hypothetical protein